MRKLLGRSLKGKAVVYALSMSGLLMQSETSSKFNAGRHLKSLELTITTSYTLAADLNANLDDLSRSLLQMIDSVNSLSADERDGSDAKSKNAAPLEQIAQILASHLEGLQWIDGAVREVDAKVNEVERAMREASAGSSRNGSTAPSLNGSLNGGSSLSRSRGFGLR